MCVIGGKMGNPLGVYETNYKLKKVKNLLLGKTWPPSDLLFLEWSYCTELDSKTTKTKVRWHCPCNILPGNKWQHSKITMYSSVASWKIRWGSCSCSYSCSIAKVKSNSRPLPKSGVWQKSQKLIIGENMASFRLALSRVILL